MYVAVDLPERHGQIVQFTYEGDYRRTIDLPDDGPGFSSYPFGFDVLPDGGLLVPQPHNERILTLDANGVVVATVDVPGFRPLDTAVLSDGTIVFTDNEADNSEDALLNLAVRRPFLGRDQRCGGLARPRGWSIRHARRPLRPRSPGNPRGHPLRHGRRH